MMMDDAPAPACAPQAMESFLQDIRSKLLHTVWTTGCKNWYVLLLALTSSPTCGVDDSAERRIEKYGEEDNQSRGQARGFGTV